MSAVLASVGDEEEPAQLDFFDTKVYKKTLFSLSSANNHATDVDLDAKQVVRFAGQGAVDELTLKGFLDGDPKKVYKIKADMVDLDPSCRHCGKPV